METLLKERNRYNLIEKVSKAFAFYLVCIFPLMIGQRKYENITEFKFKTFVISTIVYSVISALICLYYTVSSEHIFRFRKAEQKQKLTVAQIALLAYVVWNIISSIKSPYGKDIWIGQGRFEGLFSVLLYSTVFILLSFWGEYSKWYMRGLGVMTAIFAVISFMQFTKTGIIYPEGYNYPGYYFLGTLGHHDVVGGLVSIVVPALFASYVLSDDKYWGEFELLAAVFMAFVFFVTDVDSGKIGLLVGFTVMIPFLFDSRESLAKTLVGLAGLILAFTFYKAANYFWGKYDFNFDKKAWLMLAACLVCYGLSWVVRLTKFSLGLSVKTVRIIVLAILVFVLIFAVVFVFTYKGDQKLIKEASEMLHGRLDDKAGTERGYIWKTSWNLAKQCPVYGSGPGTFLKRYQAYEIFDTTTDFAHNDFIQNAVCIGFVGMGLYVLFCLSLAVRAFSKGYKNGAIVILGAGCAGYLAHSFFSFSIAIITPLFWAFAGVLDKVVRQVEWSEAISSRNSVKKEHKQ